MADPLRYDVEVSPEATRQLAGQASGVLRAMAASMTGEMKRLMSLPKTGRAYRRGRTAIHIASAPGEAPAVDREGLIGSINWQMNGELQAVVSINANYAAYLEYGTRFMARRPYVEPAIEKVRTDFAGILGQTRLRVNR
jgi:hypothetical protein